MQATTFIRANISKLYAFWFFHNLVFAYVIERLFWAGRGITIPQVVYLEILYSVVVFLLEVPTGALADRFGRKPMMILGAVFSFGEMLIDICLELWCVCLCDHCRSSREGPLERHQ
ncbi:MAG: hypothetical protein PWR07_1337 [Bacillota bacterium]|nr:hypothetical protein [Bacillota bacterium]